MEHSKVVVLFKINKSGNLSRVSSDLYSDCGTALRSQTEEGIYIPMYCDKLTAEPENGFVPGPVSVDNAAYYDQVLTYTKSLTSGQVELSEIPEQYQKAVIATVDSMSQIIPGPKTTTNGGKPVETDNSQGEANS